MLTDAEDMSVRYEIPSQRLYTLAKDNVKDIVQTHLKDIY